MDRLVSLSNGCEVYENEEYLEPAAVKEEPISEDEVSVDIPLECLLCAKKLHTVTGLKAHVITHHNYKSVKRKCGDCPSPEKIKRQKHVCTTCGRSFVTSTDLKVHEVCHNEFCCFVCNAKFNSFKEVSQHRRRCKKKNTAGAVPKPKTLTDILNERKALRQPEKCIEKHKQLRVKCLRCTDSFTDVLSYKLHKNLKHGEIDTSDNLDKKNEIEISNVATVIKQEQNDNDQTDAKSQENNTVVKDNKEIIDISNVASVIKQEPNDNDETEAKSQENDTVVKANKEEVDYSKIETELESIFDIALEKCHINVTILENESDKSNEFIDSKDKDDSQMKSIEEILKSPGLSQESEMKAKMTAGSDGKQKNEQQVDLNQQSKKVSKKNSSIPTVQKSESNVLNNKEGTSNLSNEKLSEESETYSSFSSHQVSETDGQNNKKNSNNKAITTESFTDDSSIDATDSIKEVNKNTNKLENNHNKNSELDDPTDVQPKTNVEQDKENEKPEQNGDTELLNNKTSNNDENNKNINVTIEQSAIAKALNNGERNSADFIEKEDKCDETEHREVFPKGVENSEQVEECIEK